MREDEQTSDSRPIPTGFEDWDANWTSQEMSWRIEPEIDEERQLYLAERRSVQPDIAMGIYPFRDEDGSIHLTRADVEWLLATHESGGLRGPVDASDDKQRSREGLDLRGADLNGVSLNGLPLTRMRGGLSPHELGQVQPPERDAVREAAAIHLRGAYLIQARLEAAILTSACLDGAVCYGIHLEGAYLQQASLQFANLMSAHLEGAILIRARLDGSIAHQTHLEGAILSNAQLERAQLPGAHLEGATLQSAYLRQANLRQAHLEGAILQQAQLEGAALHEARLTGKVIADADLKRIRKWMPNFMASMPPANLRDAVFDNFTRLDGVTLGDDVYGTVRLADAHFNGVNLAVVDWAPVKVLGDELEARKAARNREYTSQPEVLLGMYLTGVRANRQLAVALRSQGLSEDADRFAYRAQVLRRQVLWRQTFLLQTGKRIDLFERSRKLATYCGSWFLSIIAGYGYRPGRSILAYLLLVSGFAVAYYLLGAPLGHPGAYHLQWYEALVVSLTAFHGRGFFAQQYSPGDPQSILAAIEAVVGLLLEISFIATFTQRFFAH